MRLRPTPICAVMVAALVACERPADEAFDAGSGSAEGCSVERDLVATLGSVHDPVSVRSTQAVYVAGRPEGGWVVADFPSEVLTYRQDGGFVGRWGERGQGPGEWSDPARVITDRSDSLWVSNLRARAVLFSEEGHPGRTVSSPDLAPVEGFTASNHPWSVLFQPDPEDRTRGSLVARISDRNGSTIRYVGPGVREERDHQLAVPMLIAPGTTAVGDTIFASVGPDLWLARWTISGEDTLTTGEAIREAEAMQSKAPGGALPEFLPEPTGIAAAADGGFWVAGIIRRLSPAEEEALREEERIRRGLPSGTLEVARSIEIRNRVYDGVLLHLSREGEVTGAAFSDEIPLGFVSGSEQHFTVRSAESGFLEIQIWASKIQCNGSGPETRADGAFGGHP